MRTHACMLSAARPAAPAWRPTRLPAGPSPAPSPTALPASLCPYRCGFHEASRSHGAAASLPLCPRTPSPHSPPRHERHILASYCRRTAHRSVPQPRRLLRCLTPTTSLRRDGCLHCCGGSRVSNETTWKFGEPQGMCTARPHIRPEACRRPPQLPCTAPLAAAAP